VPLATPANASRWVFILWGILAAGTGLVTPGLRSPWCRARPMAPARGLPSAASRVCRSLGKLHRAAAGRSGHIELLGRKMSVLAGHAFCWWAWALLVASKSCRARRNLLYLCLRDSAKGLFVPMSASSGWPRSSHQRELSVISLQQQGAGPGAEWNRQPLLEQAKFQCHLQQQPSMKIFIVRVASLKSQAGG